ncbi:hypothetical protein BK634_28915 [Pseudomonas chlororaphis]|nr:hypothetical protein BK634_28915 [Pseudomonas chlororaphis]
MAPTVTNTRHIVFIIFIRQEHAIFGRVNFNLMMVQDISSWLCSCRPFANNVVSGRIRRCGRSCTIHSGSEFFTGQAQRIDPCRRIRRIGIQIEPARLADRILADKSPNRRIIILVSIVMQSCFVVVILALETYRVNEPLLLCECRALLKLNFI